MGLFSSIFGGGTSSASEQSVENQQAANAAARQFIEQQSGRARSDVMNLFPQAQDARNQGYDNAFGMIAGGIPEQMNMFNQGNYGAQEQVANTLPQVSNALMGLPVDYSQFQPQQMQPDMSYMQQYMPTDQPTFAPTTGLSGIAQGGNTQGGGPRGGRGGGYFGGGSRGRR